MCRLSSRCLIERIEAGRQVWFTLTANLNWQATSIIPFTQRC
jgi:hypothetical protein